MVVIPTMVRVLFFISFILIGSRGFADPATGTINGTAWTFQSGTAFIKNDNVKITLWNEPFDSPCNEWRGSVFDVRAIFPSKTGLFMIDPNSYTQNVIILGDAREIGSPNNNIFANVGSLKVTEITNTEVKGTISATYTPKGSSVSGDFTVPICLN